MYVLCIDKKSFVLQKSALFGVPVDVQCFHCVSFTDLLRRNGAGLAAGAIGIGDGIFVQDFFFSLKFDLAKDRGVGTHAISSLSLVSVSRPVFEAAGLFGQEKARIQELGLGS